MNYSNLRQLAERYEVTLGSSSPRRVRLLTETGISFKQVVPDLDETILPDEDPVVYAERLAADKAMLVGRGLPKSRIVIGCDTVVVLDNEILGKPENEEGAFAILSRLSGQRHTVYTALALCGRGSILAVGHEATGVQFNEVTFRQIRDYIATGEPMDKAGAYGIQGMGAFLVDSIEGNLDNVIGLPRQLLDYLARRALQNL